MSELNANQKHAMTEVLPLVANQSARRYKAWSDRDDIAQELRVWIWQHGHKLDEWVELEHEGEEKLGYADRMTYRSLTNAASRYCQEQKARRLGYEPDDVYYWNEGEVRALLPELFRPEAISDPPQFDGEGRDNRLPNERGGWQATLADLGRAYESLPGHQRSLLYEYFGEGESQEFMAESYGVTQPTMSNRITRAVRALLDELGGRAPGNPHFDDCDHPGRRAISNAQAMAISSSQYDDQ